MALDLRPVIPCAAVVAGLALACACTPETDDIHQLTQTRNQACYDCHSTAYEIVQTPVHRGVIATTCQDCHSTTAWIPLAVGDSE